jgi:Putative adhesin
MKAAIVLALSCLALAPACASADEWNHHWSVASKPELHVTAGDAAVVIETGSDNSIDATLTTRGWSIGSNGVRVSEHQTGNHVEIDVRVPETHFHFGEHAIRLEIRVPRELAGDLHTGDGSITLRGLHGTLRADTGDGSVQAEDLDGTLDAHTGDGSVHVRGRFDGLRLHTQDGSVEVEAARGSRMQTDWRVQTGDGSVRVNLPRDFAADIELHTGDGRIRLELPLSVSGLQNDHEVQGKLNGGGALLLVRTGDGSITLGSL